MGVSKAAVSKWEKGQSYPDITLLPQLAAFFNISVDELLGYSPQLTRKDARTLCRRLSTDFTTKSFDKVMGECREIIKKYYACIPLHYQMAVLFINHYVSAPKERQGELIKEAKSLCEHVVKESSDALLARNALYIQCHCCIMLEMPGEVFTLLGESLNISNITEDSLISQAFELAGNTAKAKEISQCGMYYYLLCLIETTLYYTSLTEDNFALAQTAFERAITLIHLYGVAQLNVNTLVKAYLIGASMYSKNGYSAKALELLEKYADLCLGASLPFKLCGDDFFTDIDEWLGSEELGFTLNYDEKLLKKNMLQDLIGISAFAPIQDNKRYKSIVQRITDFANKE
jgi:transcriptional regulator with XRE-family HTH domain